MKREIWFYRIGWQSYMPCHWKGFVVLFSVTTVTLTTYFIAQHQADILGFKGPAVDVLMFLIFLAGVVTLCVIGHRHSD